MRNFLLFFVSILPVLSKEYDALPLKCEIVSTKMGSIQFLSELLCVGLADDDLEDFLENDFKGRVLKVRHLARFSGKIQSS